MNQQSEIKQTLVLSNANLNLEIQVNSPTFTLGRALDNSFVFPEDHYSRYHAVIEYSNQNLNPRLFPEVKTIKGRYWIMDNGSLMGTYYKIDFPLELKQDIIIEMGDTQF